MSHYLKDELYELIKRDERIFEFIQEGSLDGLWYWDLEQPENEWMNARFWQVLGYDPDEMPHQASAWQNIINQDDLKITVENVNKHLENPDHPYDQEVRYTHKNGSVVWVRCRGVAIRDEQGKPVRMVGAHQDITSLKKTEARLEESEALYRIMFEKSSMGMARVSPEGKFIQVNRKFCSIVGYTCDELLSMDIAKITHPDDLRIDEKYIKKVLNNEIDEYTLEKRYIHKNNSIIWIRLTSSAVRKADGNVDFAIASIINITEQKNAEAETALLAEMLDTAPNSITIHDTRGNFLYANQKTFEIHGYSPEEYMSLSLKDIDVPESAELMAERIQSIKDKGYGEFEVEHFKKDGSRIPLEIFVKYVKWKGSSALLSIATDISERKKWIQELIVAKEKAEEASRLKTEFLNNMSHEIRTPMNGIIGFSDMLYKEDISNEKRKYYSKIVQNSSYQLLRVIDDILEISTLETKQEKPVEEAFYLNDLLMELFSIFSLNAKERNLSIHLKKELSDNQSNIISDKSKLNKILSNLMENALKFTIEGYVEIGYFLKHNKLVLYVKDTGIGIAPQNHEVIFDRFSQEDKEVSKKHGGLGLGLSISKENAILLGGDITLESEKGKGAIFYVTLPYQPAKKIETDNPVAAQSGKDKKKQESLTILVAEDEEVNYLYIEALLEALPGKNVKLLHAINGKEAVDLCMTEKIDLVLMDIKMPVMGGLEATEKIKEKFPALPVIAQTAYSTESDKQLTLNHGCDGFISKPLDQDNLFKLIGKHVHIG